MNSASIDYFDFADYQKQAKTTFATDSSMAVIALGVAGEAGEVADLVKKIVGHKITTYKGKDALEALSDELGDVLWYISAMCTYLGINMSDVALNNIKKLQERYPNGFVTGGGIR